MPQTHLCLYFHIVFHTKNNRPSIHNEWRDRLHAFLGGCIKTAGGIAIAIGGTNDHIHLLISLRATHRLADVVKDVKVASSKWVHQEIGTKLFGWQNGYGAFTVSPLQIEKVRQYVLNQEQHHRKKTVKQEYVEFLRLSVSSMTKNTCGDPALLTECDALMPCVPTLRIGLDSDVPSARI